MERRQPPIGGGTQLIRDRTAACDVSHQAQEIFQHS